MTKPTITADDCKHCGACCTGGYADYEWADCTVEDVRRMSRRVRRQLITSTMKPLLHDDEPAMTPTNSEGSCIFLRGTPGVRVSCRIYETRPKVCRDFKPGSLRCRAARRELNAAREE